MAALEDLAIYLASKGYGTVGTNIFMDHRPDDPVEMIALFGVPGMPPVEHMGGSIPAIEGLRVEAQVRSKSHTIAENRARDIWGDFHRLIEVTYNGARYHRVWSMNSPYLEERDSQRNWIFTCTFNVWRRVEGS